MSLILTILGILCLGYYIFLQLLHMDFAIIWLLVGILLILSRWFEILPVWGKIGIGIVIAVGIVVFLLTEILIIGKMNSKGNADLDYVIVLGAQVRGERPSRALNKRIQKAGEYLKSNPNTKAILSGGQGPGEEITEAECMRRGLEKLGIDPNRLILEDKSTTTKENLIFSSRLAPVKRAQTGLITQNFHIYRSLKLAEKQKYEHICGIAAESEWLYQPHFMVREGFALVKEVLAGNVSIHMDQR